MYQLLKSHHILKRLAVCFLLVTLPGIAAADKTGPIVVTIKPLYSLVAHLTEGIEQPKLLMQQMQSPHHYTMRPSERRLLSDARVVIWIGPQMETYLSKVIKQQDSLSISAMQAKGIKLLDRRTKSSQRHAAEHAEPDNLMSDNLDPHIWLSTENAIAISQHISQQLSISNPGHSDRYSNNLQRLIKKITQLSDEIKTSLQDNKQPYITHHDAFQYFENEYGLNYIDSISADEETGVSLKHLRHIKASIEKNDIQCLLYQPPEPDIIATLTRNTIIKAVALDPLGQTISNKKDAWFEIMRDIALNFNHCLNS